jgi:nickel-dependent lactate racemase
MDRNAQIAFDFGRHQIDVKIPEYADILPMGRAEPLRDPEKTLRQALQQPQGTPSLARIVQAKLREKPEATAVVVISDDTRPVPYAGESGILFPLIDEMIDAGLSPQSIRLLVATGTHHAMDEKSLRQFLDPRIFSLGISIFNHNCRAQDELTFIGQTELGGDIYLNTLYMESDIRILTGLVESHFMAGASGGRKSICPGLLAEKSIHILHAGLILSSPHAADLVIDKNPVHDEALEVARIAGCDMIVNVTLDSSYRLTGIYVGDLEHAHQEAVHKLKTYASIPVQHTYDLVITHCGFVGINHYQAAKGALVCVPIVKPGGTCILAGSHPDTDPIGSENYQAMMKLLAEIGPQRYLEAILNAAWKFVPDQWEAQMWTRLLQIIPQENLIYCTFDIPSQDFNWLPGTDARALAPQAQDLAALINSTVAWVVSRFTEDAGHPPSIAVLPDGPYGIPMLHQP